MGIFNVIKFANDYAKLKVYLDTRKEEVGKLIGNVKKFLEYMNEIKEHVDKVVKEVKEVIQEAEKIIKGGK